METDTPRSIGFLADLTRRLLQNEWQCGHCSKKKGTSPSIIFQELFYANRVALLYNTANNCAGKCISIKRCIKDQENI